MYGVLPSAIFGALELENTGVLIVIVSPALKNLGSTIYFSLIVAELSRANISISIFVFFQTIRDGKIGFGSPINISAVLDTLTVQTKEPLWPILTYVSSYSPFSSYSPSLLCRNRI